MDIVTLLRAVTALGFVLALIGAGVWLLRRAGAKFAPGNAGRRITLVESRAIDLRHKLVLIRRDEVEHLLLLGPGGVKTIERGIKAPAPGAQP